ncbi:AfsR/SARP family transcriptional regulator [Neokomagataea anthophila]|uniref:Uncharacterized protein n=1 Tax=Neokomagataea anthophila TaxID=2826925 RepID=A0ABS5E8C4_9PROT|nr:hypothetical protein [Neokomagataea anthophila]MBR0560155.1 hypothetical protein [Neokomagataea anthophila]
MARASLRQEIHRLQEALRPLGVNVVDVQRSSLTLKPILTSVDVERLKSGGLNAAGAFMEAGEKLLPDLDGVDPALDEWLEVQRFNLRKYSIAQYEASLLEVRDLAGIEDAASRLLAIDELNQAAWCARIEAAVRAHDLAQARSFVIQFKRLVSEAPTEIYLEQATQDLLERVLRYDQNTALGHFPSEMELVAPFSKEVCPFNDRKHAQGFGVNLGLLPDSGDISFSESDPMLVSPFHMKSGKPDIARRISVHIQSPTILEPEHWKNCPSSDDLHECLEMFFLRAKLFQVVPFQGNGEGEDYIDLCKKSGIDYVVRSILRVGFQDSVPRIIVRLMDIRSGGIVVWGGYESVAELNSQNIDKILGDIFSDIHWSIVFSDLMRVSSRKDEELSRFGKSMRAVGLSLRFNTASFDRAIKLIGAPSDEAHTALATTITALARLNSDFQSSASEIIQWGIEGARQAMALQPERSAVALLWGLLTMVEGDALLSSVSHKTSLYSVIQGAGVPLSAREHSMYAALEALLDQDAVLAAKMVQEMLGTMNGSPLRAFYEMLFLMTLVVGLPEGKALEQANRMVCLYPRHPMSAVSLVVAAVRTGLQGEERARIFQHVRSLVPALTIEDVLKRCAYLPQQGVAMIRSGLMQAEFQ